jgi:hypothetical protein
MQTFSQPFHCRYAQIQKKTPVIRAFPSQKAHETDPKVGRLERPDFLTQIPACKIQPYLPQISNILLQAAETNPKNQPNPGTFYICELS